MRIKKISSIVLIVFLLSSIAYSSSNDYMQGVNMKAMNIVHDKIINYPNKKIATQNVIDFDDTCKFKDLMPINCVKVNKDDKFRMNKIAITIDDSFVDTYTEDILDVLDKHNCKATFFITYKLMNANPDRIYDILDRGHEIGNHTTTHAPFKNLHSQRKIWEIITLNTWFNELTGSNMCLLRFPTGSYDDEAINFSKNLNMYPIGWSIDSRDWELKDLKKIFEEVKSQRIQSGDIVLLHNGYKFSKELFDKLLTHFEEKGFSYIKVSDLLYKRNFKVIKGVQFSNNITSVNIN